MTKVTEKILNDFDNHLKTLNIPNIDKVLGSEVSAALSDFTKLGEVKRELWNKRLSKN